MASNNYKNLQNIHRFSSEAMATIFEIYISHENRKYASQAAQQAFDLLDEIERQLSRFKEESDISLIAKADADTQMTLSLHTFECLVKSKKIFQMTKGYFDVSYLSPVFLNHITLNEEDISINITQKDIQLDLGGVGKGYALEKMAEVLKDWDIRSALIHGGNSSVKALASPENKKWNINLKLAYTEKILTNVGLENICMGSSGLLKGMHITDPVGKAPLKYRRSSWVFCKDAAEADAVSTAVIAMPERKIEQLCRECPQFRVVLVNMLSDKKYEYTLYNFDDKEDLNNLSDFLK